jgi:hypothetical protein
MKILVLHGDDTVKLYDRFVKFTDVAKKRGWEIVNYDLDNLSNQSLFGKERFYIVRDFKILTKKDISSFDKYDGNIVIYHEGTLPAAFLKSLKEPKIEEFKLPKMLWNFLDNITVENLHKIIKTEPIEFVFIMIAWKMKKKYLANPDPKIAKIIEKLAQIDYEVKTGKADLLLSLDLLIMKDLQFTNK